MSYSAASKFKEHYQYYTEQQPIQLTAVQHVSPVPKKMEQVIRMYRFKQEHSERFHQLTKREVEILKLLANGYNNPQIAERLFISRQTVETHRKNVKRKLELKSLLDLMRYAFAFDLVEC